MKFLPLFLILCATICNAQDFWQPTGGPQDGAITILVKDSTGGIYAANENPSQLFRSTDEGRSWVRIPNAPAAIRALAVDPQGRLVVATSAPGFQGVVATSDRGESWDTLGSETRS